MVVAPLGEMAEGEITPLKRPRLLKALVVWACRVASARFLIPQSQGGIQSKGNQSKSRA